MSVKQDNVSDDDYDDEEESDNENECPLVFLYLKQSRFYFYEPSNTYIGLAMTFVYIVLSALQYTFDRPYPWLLLIPAVLTNLPHFFRHHFDYLPKLFSQVFSGWVCLLYSLTMIYFLLPIVLSMKPGENPPVSAFIGFSCLPLSLIHLFISYYTDLSYKFIYMRHHLGPLKMQTFWIISVIEALSCVCLVVDILLYPNVTCLFVKPYANVLNETVAGLIVFLVMSLSVFGRMYYSNHVSDTLKNVNTLLTSYDCVFEHPNSIIVFNATNQSCLIEDFS